MTNTWYGRNYYGTKRVQEQAYDQRPNTERRMSDDLPPWIAAVTIYHNGNPGIIRGKSPEYIEEVNVMLGEIQHVYSPEWEAEMEQLDAKRN